MSEYALHMIKTNAPEAGYRYKGENIMSYELDMPLRTTYEYSNPKVSASLQAVLAEAMQTEDDIDITDQSNYASMMKQRLDKITRRNQDGGGQSGSGGGGGGSNGAGSSSNGIPSGSSSGIGGIGGGGSSNGPLGGTGSGVGGVANGRARSSIYNRGMSAAPTFGAHSTTKKVVPPASAAPTFPKARGLIPK